MIAYTMENFGQTLSLDERVVEHFLKHRQLRWWQSEAGGQLFARDHMGELRIELATGPRKGDRRWRYGYVPDRRAEQQEIEEQHRAGLHFVGDWHTHPQKHPRMSKCDRASISECYRKSKHELNCFVLIIVGQVDGPAGLEVSLHTADAHTVLEPV